MQFTTPLLRGKLIRRYKRFLADVELPDGTEVTAHCPNTGGMTGCAEPGYEVWLSHSNNPKRKLAYTWELAKTHEGHFIGINTHAANALVAEAIDNKVIDLFTPVVEWKREVTPPGSDSRFDFVLRHSNGQARYLEVKSVTLLQHGRGYFPDAVTIRGAKHCDTLGNLAAQGVPTTLAFCIQHSGINSVSIAEHIDPDYGKAVREARDKGMEIIALGCEINEQNITINQALPVIL
ncbi:DNA/RNA nuclease SfsA [Aestuariibacter sp. A3R04]|uniref:DNA/RNA nuclease SfsA n=1 Tax=Aestuariibacter sp. A3R04 TaxID=2841571 RepID=UPI001C08CF00|nr:DNA/RNA nuclease SfsA [Aestuariibacter sp. A3R04]MBU3023900.1 DNA/RNA nuclease SfsA [Aestuariibacter sp. A3R04]